MNGYTESPERIAARWKLMQERAAAIAEAKQKEQHTNAIRRAAAAEGS